VIICILFLASYFSLSVAFNNTFDKSSNNENFIFQEERVKQTPSTSDYAIEGPINISSQSDWASYGFITGDGSELNPYVIENIEIQGDGVKTREQMGHDYLDYLDIGIYINAAGNCTIRNCKISSISFGIYLDFGISTDDKHDIQGVEIDNCGMGIYVWGIGGGGYIKVNISRCDISNCHWVTVKVPEDLFTPLYGGFGMWVRADEGSIIELCHIRNCSIGVLSGPAASLISNQLINCGFLFDFNFILTYSLIFNNTINGRPLGLFTVEENLILSGQEASQYGQLIFAGCHYLHLSNFKMNESCSFGLLLYYCNHPVLQNIVCENQQIGFFIYSDYMTADNLDAKNCTVGFSFARLRSSILNRLSMENIDIPLCAYVPIVNASIRIEKSTRCYLIDYYNIDEIQINSSVSSIIIPRSNLSEFDIEGFMFELNETGTYHIYGFDPIHHTPIYDFTIIIFEPSKPFPIPGFPLIWFYIAILLAISYLKYSIQYKNNKMKRVIHG